MGAEITRNAFVEQTLLGLASKEVRGNLFPNKRIEASAANVRDAQALVADGGTPGQIQRAQRAASIAAAEHQELLNNVGQQFDYQSGKMLVGAGILATGTTLALAGLVTGSGPSNPDENRVWRMANAPNSLTIGGISIPLARAGAIGLLFLTPANLKETIQYWDPKEKTIGDLALSVMHMITNVSLEETFLRTFKDLADAAFHPQEHLPQFLYQWVPNWEPYSIGLGQTARVMDRYQKEIHSIFDAVKARQPVWSFDAYNKRDIFGEPIHIANTFQVERYYNDPVVKEMDNLKMGIGKLEHKLP